MSVLPLKKMEREAAAQRRQPESSGKTRFFPRNGRTYGWKHNALQTKNAYAGKTAANAAPPAASPSMNDTLTDQLCAAVAELIAAQPEHPGPACRRFQDSWQASRATENAPSRRLSDDMADAATHVAAKLKSVLPDCPSGKKQNNLPLSRLACGDAERSQKKLKSAPHRPTPRCKQHSGNVCRNKGSLPMYRHSCVNCRRMPSLCCRPVTPRTAC